MRADDQDQTSALAASHPEYQDDEINLMELLLVLAKHNRFILKGTGIAAILAMIASLLMPNVYKAEAVIMPPREAPSAAGIVMSQVAGLTGMGAALGMKNPSDIYGDMLKSRTVADALIARFKLKAYYDQATMTLTRKRLQNDTDIKVEKDGAITINFSSKDPQFAATVTNAYVEELGHLSQTMATTEAVSRRLFFERQLKATKGALANAELSLKQTQEKTGLIVLDKQAEAIVGAIADLRAKVATKEVELAAMRAFATTQNPDYRLGQEVLSGLKAQLAKVERSNVAGNGDIMVPTAKIPAASLEYLQKLREVKYQETLFEMLSKQLEMARIDELRVADIIKVMDQALPPDRKDKPKRALIVILVTMLAFCLMVLAAFLKEANPKAAQDPAAVKQWQLLKRYLRQGA